MKIIFLLLLMIMSPSTHATVYKCVKDGQTSYSNDRCANADIVATSSNKENIEEDNCSATQIGLPSNKKRNDGAELHVIGVYEGPVNRSSNPSDITVNVRVLSTERPIILALFNYESVVWNITINKGASVREIIINSSDGTQLSGINEKVVKVTRQNTGYTAHEKCTFYSAVASKIQEFSGHDVQSFQGAYNGLEFVIQVRNKENKQITVPVENGVSHKKTDIVPAKSQLLRPSLADEGRTGVLSSKLKGSWVIDPKATENFVLNATPPSNASKLAGWFELAGGYWTLFTYEFDGDSATMSAYRGARKFEFQLLSQQGTEIKYTLKNDTSSPTKTLSVFLFKDGNIKIVPSESPESGYVLWKRGALKTEQATPDDVMAVSKTWLVSLQNIVKFLRGAPEKTYERPIPIEKEDPRPVLEAAIRNGTIRRATPADAQAWLDADVEKYRRKNLSPLDNSHESSILSAEISKSSAYVVLKQYTYPPGLKNNNKAIFLIPRNVPVPDGNYGDSKIYHFYTEYFAGTSVEFSAGSPW